MQQILHLLVVDHGAHRALIERCGDRWILPIMCVDERARVGALVAEWARHGELNADVVCQWLGRATHDAVDWLVVLRSRHVDARWGTESTLVALDALSRVPALVEYQGWSVRHVTAGDVISIAGPFGTLSWIDAACEWISHIAGGIKRDETLVFRATPYEVVCRMSSERGYVYFKGLPESRAVEVRATALLQAVAPGTVPKTLALERRNDGTVWWLTDHCTGELLSHCLTFSNIQLAARAYARLQRRTVGRLACSIPAMPIEEALSWSVSLLESALSRDEGARCIGRLNDAVTAVQASGMPIAWAPLDPDPGNLLIDDGCVRFIDLDRSFVGPPAIVVSAFVRRVCRAAGKSLTRDEVATIRAGYVDEWRSSVNWTKSWDASDCVSLLLDCYLDWNVLMEKVERGEIHDVVDLARERTIQRLLRAANEPPPT